MGCDTDSLALGPAELPISIRSSGQAFAVTFDFGTFVITGWTFAGDVRTSAGDTLVPPLSFTPGGANKFVATFPDALIDQLEQGRTYRWRIDRTDVSVNAELFAGPLTRSVI